MSDRNDSEEMHLDDDLRALHEELSSIRYEERPSFAPELRAELARAWASPPPRRRPGLVRHLAAATLAGLLLAGASVPTARASLVRFLGGFGGGEVVETPDLAIVVEAPEPEASVEVEATPVEELPLEAIALPVEPPPVTVVAEEVRSEPIVPPEWLDRERSLFLLEDAYPLRLQRAGVGGVVWLRVWVDVNGITGRVDVARASGVPELDRAALRVAPLFRFAPALEGGVPVGTWIEFPVLFEPDEDRVEPAPPRPVEDPLRLPTVLPSEEWEFDEPLTPGALPEWSGDAPEAVSEVERELVAAIGDPTVLSSLGPIEAVLSGIAPEGRDPTEWRAAARVVLEDAARRAPDNPAPFLALGRIRLRQGLRTDARMLFEQGLQIAIQGGSASAGTAAELHYERGRILRDSWATSRGVGRVRAFAFEGAPCAQARPTGSGASGFASIERLIAWNYLCPTQLAKVFDFGFEEGDDGLIDLTLMMGSFRAAVAAQPGHAAANVGYLMALAEAGRWDDVLRGARRFARHSDGHPHALLVAGLALQQLGQVAEADGRFAEALRRLPAAEADVVRDVTFLLDPLQRDEYRRLWGEERRAWEASFWPTRDRTDGNDVNEREVQHLARSTYALLRFGGTASDPGEVWVRFGGPNRVHVVDEGAGQLTEFWDYGSGPDITFVRRVASQSMDLTPEGRAYVDDLGKIFPPE